MLISCDKGDLSEQEIGKLEIVFKARFGTEPLVYGNQYNYFDEGSILFSKTDFFYSYLKLLGPGDSVLVDDVNYIALMNHHTSSALAEKGLSVIYDNIPVGNYDALEFNMGLSHDQNLSKPSDYPLGHPMGDGSRYHPAFNSFIFNKTEGLFKNTSNYFFDYHPGFDNSLRKLNFIHPITIEKNQKTQIIIQIDYKRMFQNQGVAVDIVANPQIYYFSEFMIAFVNQFQHAVTIL